MSRMQINWKPSQEGGSNLQITALIVGLSPVSTKLFRYHLVHEVEKKGQRSLVHLLLSCQW